MKRFALESEEEMEVFYESLSTKIKDILRLVSNHLCSSLTWEVFIDFERSEKFNSIFVTYLQSIEQLQATVSVYIKVCLITYLFIFINKCKESLQRCLSEHLEVLWLSALTVQNYLDCLLQ